MYNLWNRMGSPGRRRAAIMAAVTLLAAAGIGWMSAPWPPRLDTALGERLFRHRWEIHDPMSAGGDGLGPVFNARSCVECHYQGGTGGGGALQNNVQSFEVLPTGDRRQVKEGVVHVLAIAAQFQESRDGVAALYPVVPGGLRVSYGCTTRLEDFDPVSYSSINTPALFGAGLIDQISSWAIRSQGTRRVLGVIGQELSSDFSGTPVGRVRPLALAQVGRFGWKGQFATLEEFVANACAMELGLTNPMQSQQLPNCYQQDGDALLDINKRQLEALVQFVAALPRPVEVLPSDAHERSIAEHGQVLFSEVGCADCHSPNLGGVEGIYSDLRLYTIEYESRFQRYETVDGVEPPLSHPRPNEWKTPPLWGVADSAPYFHDGGSPTLETAIIRHAGDAQSAQERFKALTDADRQALIAFLKTLRAPTRVPVDHLSAM